MAFSVVSSESTGLTVTRVRFGSAAHTCGLHVGDIIVRVNKRHMHAKAQFFLSLLEARPGDAFLLELLRPPEDDPREKKHAEARVARTGKQPLAKANGSVGISMHAPVTLRCQIGATQFPQDALLALFRLANHLQQPSIYGSVSPESLFQEDLRLVSGLLSVGGAGVEGVDNEQQRRYQQTDPKVVWR